MVKKRTLNFYKIYLVSFSIVFIFSKTWLGNKNTLSIIGHIDVEELDAGFTSQLISIMKCQPIPITTVYISLFLKANLFLFIFRVKKRQDE